MPLHRAKPLPSTGTASFNIHFQPTALAQLRALADANGLNDTETLRTLVSAEAARRTRARPPAPPPPRDLPSPPGPAANRSYRFTRDEIAAMDALIRIMASTEGVLLNRSTLLARLLHDETRRSMSHTG